MLTRKQFLLGGILGSGSIAHSYGAANKRVRVGIMDGSLRLPTQLEAVNLAAKLGLDGLEINCGRSASGGRLPLADPELQNRYFEELSRHKIAIAGVVLSILHVNYLKNDPLALKWVSQGIGIARSMRSKVLLLPSFGKGAIQSRQEADHVADILREPAAEAQKASVILGLENTLSAEDNARILDRINSPAVKVYYDVGNSTNMGGFDSPAEIRWLGRNRICQIHIKDKGYLGEGRVSIPEVVRALRDIRYEGFANLETSSPSGSVEADVGRNLAYLRKLLED